jgi:putative ABC transport system permease protein
MEEKGAGFGSPDNQIFIPLTTGNRLLFGQDYVGSINVQTKNEQVMEATTQQIERLLRQRHRLRPGQESDFNVRSQTEILSMIQQTSQTFTLLLGGIASVSLLVGGIGIMNIMLVSVTERTREIGIRKALGARRRDILWQFLIEALVLSVRGGRAGTGRGGGGAHLMRTVFGFKTLTTAKSILVAFGFAAATGIFFGLYPASRASQLDPIEALRYE